MFDATHITPARETINILAERREFKVNGTTLKTRVKLFSGRARSNGERDLHIGTDSTGSYLTVTSSAGHALFEVIFDTDMTPQKAARAILTKLSNMELGR